MSEVYTVAVEGDRVNVSAMSSVPTIGQIPGLVGALAAKIDASLIAVAEGLATLDGTGVIPISQLPSAIFGTMQYRGSWDAATNSPAMVAASTGNQGDYFVVSVSGATAVDGIADWQVGDWIVSNGAIWQKIDNSDLVVSVAGLTGAVSASALRAALSLVVGADVQAFSAKLAAVAALVWAADTAPYFTGAGTVDKFGLSSFMRGLMGTASAGALLSAIGALSSGGGTVSGLLTINSRVQSITTGAENFNGERIGYAPSFIGIRGNGTTSAVTPAVLYDTLAAFDGRGYYDGSNKSASIGGFRINAAENFAPGALGTYAIINTTPVGATVQQERLRVDPSGNLCMGGANVVISSERLHGHRVVTLATLSALSPVQGDQVYVSDLFGVGGMMQCVGGGAWRPISLGDGVSTLDGNADATVTPLVNAANRFYTGTLTANRTLTLSTTNAVAGMVWHITRLAGGAFDFSIGGLKTLAQNQWCRAIFNGTSWVLQQFGSL